MFELHRCHVRLPIDSGHQIATGVVSILKPETRNRGAKVQSVLVTDRLLLFLLDLFWRPLQRATLLCLGGRLGFDKQFRFLLYRLKVDRVKLTLASLKAGGATFFVESGVVVSDLQFRGRWDCQGTSCITCDKPTPRWRCLTPYGFEKYYI